MRFIPIGHDFVAEVIGIDLRAPLHADAAAAILVSVCVRAAGAPGSRRSVPTVAPDEWRSVILRRSI
jgi:hypothetical protein